MKTKPSRYLLLAFDAVDDGLTFVDTYLGKEFAERMYANVVSKKGRLCEVSLYELTEDHMAYHIIYRSTPWCMKDTSNVPETDQPTVPFMPSR